MLVLSRQRDQSVMIGEDIEIMIVDIRGDKCRIGIKAPKDVRVDRKEVLVRIVHRRRVHGHSPTLQGMADEMGVSKVTVFSHVTALVQAGLLTRERYKSRSIVPVGGR